MDETGTDAVAPQRVRRIRRTTRPLRNNLVVSAALLLTFVVYTWLVVRWSPFIRFDYYMNRNYHVRTAWPVLHVLDRIGQRAVCLPILAFVIAVTGWRHRSWRPVLLGVIGVFSVNLLVLIVKLALSRGRPLSGESFFTDGDLYPSGHTANVVVCYGLCYHLITHYGHVSERVKKTLIAGMGVLCVVMFSTSLLLRWHWFSDLMGGFMIGGAVLALTIGIDAAVPFRSHKLVVIPAKPDAPLPPTAPGGPEATKVGKQRESQVADAESPTNGSRVSLRRKPHDSQAAVGDRPSRH